MEEFHGTQDMGDGRRPTPVTLHDGQAQHMPMPMPRQTPGRQTPGETAPSTRNQPTERRGKAKRTKTVTAKAVSPDTIGSILAAADKVRGLTGSDALVLRMLLGLPANTAENKLIATFISRDGRARALKRIDGELSILDSLKPGDPMDLDAAFSIMSLGHDERLERWTLAAAFDPEAAKKVAGTDDGKWPRNWNKSDADESKGLYALYMLIRGPYRAKMEEMNGLLG